VPFARQGQVGGTYARAVVAYGDGVETSADGGDVDPEGVGVEAVLEELLSFNYDGDIVKYK